MKAHGIPDDDFPMILVMHDGRYFRYGMDNTNPDGAAYSDPAGLLHFINRL